MVKIVIFAALAIRLVYSGVEWILIILPIRVLLMFIVSSSVDVKDLDFESQSGVRRDYITISFGSVSVKRWTRKRGFLPLAQLLDSLEESRDHVAQSEIKLSLDLIIEDCAVAKLACVQDLDFGLRWYEWARAFIKIVYC